jgi:hypothetical protein
MPEYLKTAFIKDLESQVMMGKLSYTRMLELIQEEVIKNYNKMITGVQPKILLTQDENGNLKMDDEMGKLFFGDPNANMNYKLVRERDGLTKYGREMGWIEFHENGTFKEKHDEPAIGRSCILDPHRFSFTWLTTSVTKIVEQRDDYIKFNTNNSVYELFKLNKQNENTI